MKRPTRVPALEPRTADEGRRMREAEIRRAHRLAEREAIEHGRKLPGDASLAVTD